MKRRILIPLDDDEIRNDEIERINRETRRLEEEAAHAERVREATAARDAAQERLTAAQRDPPRVVGSWPPYDPPNTNHRWRVIGATIGAHDELIELNEPKQEEPKVELQKVDTAMFVFHWENSSSVEDFIEAAGADRGSIQYYQALARMIRTVEDIPLRELPDTPPTVKRSSRIQNFS
tara:strand:- start:120 stop:653 length:534 start_codon:yes stop_codon:yes gene_type:complete